MKISSTCFATPTMLYRGLPCRARNYWPDWRPRARSITTRPAGATQGRSRRGRRNVLRRVRHAIRSVVHRVLQTGLRVGDNAQHRDCNMVQRRKATCSSPHRNRRTTTIWRIQDNPHGMYSGNRVLLPHDVAPGGRGHVRFRRQAADLRVRRQGAVPVPGAVTNAWHVRRGDTGPGTSSRRQPSSCRSRSRISQPAGAEVRVTVSFRNTTQTTWRPSDGYALGSAGPAANTTWGCLRSRWPASRPRPAHRRHSHHVEAG